MSSERAKISSALRRCEGAPNSSSWKRFSVRGTTGAGAVEHAAKSAATTTAGSTPVHLLIRDPFRSDAAFWRQVWAALARPSSPAATRGTGGALPPSGLEIFLEEREGARPRELRRRLVVA